MHRSFTCRQRSCCRTKADVFQKVATAGLRRSQLLLVSQELIHRDLFLEFILLQLLHQGIARC